MYILQFFEVQIRKDQLKFSKIHNKILIIFVIGDITREQKEIFGYLNLVGMVYFYCIIYCYQKEILLLVLRTICFRKQ